MKNYKNEVFVGFEIFKNFKKRGQAPGSVLRYILIGLVAVMILVFGFGSLRKVRTASCQTELALFITNLEESIESVYNLPGTTNEEAISVPCGIEQIYFIDLNKDKEPVYRSVYEFPIIREGMEEKKNLFLIKDKQVIESMYIGEIELNKPYFTCSDTSKGSLKLFMSGKKGGAKIANKECVHDCTFDVIQLDRDTVEDIITNATDWAHEPPGHEGWPQGTVADEFDAFEDTNQSVKIARRCNCGKEAEEAIVEIIIKPEGEVEHFKLIERIPKEYIGDLNDYLETITGDFEYFRIKSDPLIMWHFNAIDKPTTVQYMLNSDVFGDYCGDVLEAIGIGVTLASEGLTGDPNQLNVIPTATNPLFQLDPVEMGYSKTNHHVYNNLWKYVEAGDVNVKPNDKRDYTYKILDGGSWEDSATLVNLADPINDRIECRIENSNKHLICDSSSAFTAKTIDLQVTDSNLLSSTASFVISPPTGGVAPLSATITGSINPDSGTTVTYTCVGSGGSGSYTNYDWEIPDTSKLTLPAPPLNTESISIGFDAATLDYIREIKCRLKDATGGPHSPFASTTLTISAVDCNSEVTPGTCTLVGCHWCLDNDGPRTFDVSTPQCVAAAADCNYICIAGQNGAECNELDTECCDRCYYDLKQHYDCDAGLLSTSCDPTTCTCSPCSDPTFIPIPGCVRDSIDSDGDLFDDDCDCDRDNPRANGSSTNEFCDCNPNTPLPIGYMYGTAETTASGLCGDSIDNDCDGCEDTDNECGGTETNCGDSSDNDCDTLTDCDDTSDCAGIGNCCTTDAHCGNDIECGTCGADNECDYQLSGTACTTDVGGDAGTCDGAGDCVANCVLRAAYWDVTNTLPIIHQFWFFKDFYLIATGTTINAVVEGQNCGTKEIRFNVFEDDLTLGTTASTNIISNTNFASGIASSTWTSEHETGDWFDYSEYFFEAILVEDPTNTLESSEEDFANGKVRHIAVETVHSACVDTDIDTYGADGTDLRDCAGTPQAGDCKDSGTNAVRIFPSNSNVYCNCNDTDADGYAQGRTPEVCDNIDDDCDGTVDNGFTEETCSYKCAYDYNGARTGDLRCCGDDGNEGLPYQSPESNCADGRDNDCDGDADCTDSDCYGETGPNGDFCCNNAATDCAQDVCIIESCAADNECQYANNPNYDNCGTGKVCYEGSCETDYADGSTTYTVSLRNAVPQPTLCTDPTSSWWYYDTTLTETENNIGVRVIEREKCIKHLPSGWAYGCGVIQTDISDANRFGEDIIAPGGSITWNNNFVCLTTGYVYTINEKFWATYTDANGDEQTIEFEYTFNVGP